MHLVDNIQLEAAGSRRVRGSIAQFADLFHAIVAGSVNFQHVKRPALGNLHTALIVVLEIHRGPVGGVEALSEDAGDGGLTHATCSAEQIRMMQTIVVQRMPQRPASGIIQVNLDTDFTQVIVLGEEDGTAEEQDLVEQADFMVCIFVI